MITISWNNCYQRCYPKQFLIENSDYFNSMLNNIYLDSNQSIINIQLPHYIHLDNSIINGLTPIFSGLQLDIELNYHTLLSIIYILSYIQFHQIKEILEQLNKLVTHDISIDNDSPNNIIYKWLIYYHLEEYNSGKELLSNYHYSDIKIIIANILNYSYSNPNYYHLMDILYNTILDIASILITDIDISNLFCFDVVTANQYIETLSTTTSNNDYLISNNKLENITDNSINEQEILTTLNYYTNNLFVNIPWELDILISGNLLLLLFLEKINVENYSLDFYINNKPDKIKRLMEYIYDCIGDENYTINLDNMISIFSTTINYHINIHYTNYNTPLQLLYNFPFDYQEVFLVSNQLYFTTNFIKTIKTGITNIKSSIQLFDLYYTLSIPLSIYNCSLNYIKTNYKLEPERLNKNYLEKIPQIREQKYGYFLPQFNYNIEKNKYELLRVYQVEKVYYNMEFLDIFDSVFMKNINNEIILEYTDSYNKMNMKIDKYNILNKNYKIETFAIKNMKLLTINDCTSSLQCTKYKIELGLNKNNYQHLDLYDKINHLRVELSNILKTNLGKKIKTFVTGNETLLLYINYSTKIYDYYRNMINIEELIEMTNHKKNIQINGLFEIQYMTIVLNTIYIKKYLKEIYILDNINSKS